MEVRKSIPVTGAPEGHMLEIGVSSWDDNALSIRYRYPNEAGGFSRSSPEIPLAVFPEMIRFAITEGVLVIGEGVLDLPEQATAA